VVGADDEGFVDEVGSEMVGELHDGQALALCDVSVALVIRQRPTGVSYRVFGSLVVVLGEDCTDRHS